MSKRAFNVLAAPPQAAPRRPLPWALVVATLAFLLLVGRELDAWRQQLAALRYDAARAQAGAAPAMPGADTDPDAAARQALSAELTYPWDHVLNLAAPANAPVQWTLLEADAGGNALHLQVQAPDAAAFWAWLATLRRHPAVAAATATHGQAEDGRQVFTVDVTWRPRP